MTVSIAFTSQGTLQAGNAHEAAAVQGTPLQRLEQFHPQELRNLRYLPHVRSFIQHPTTPQKIHLQRKRAKFLPLLSYVPVVRHTWCSLRWRIRCQFVTTSFLPSMNLNDTDYYFDICFFDLWSRSLVLSKRFCYMYYILCVFSAHLVPALANCIQKCSARGYINDVYC